MKRDSRMQLGELLERNIGAGTMLIGCGYDSDAIPTDRTCAEDDLARSLARLEGLWAKAGQKPEALRYAAVTQYVTRNHCMQWIAVMDLPEWLRDEVQVIWHLGPCSIRRWPEGMPAKVMAAQMAKFSDDRIQSNMM